MSTDFDLKLEIIKASLRMLCEQHPTITFQQIKQAADILLHEQYCQDLQTLLPELTRLEVVIESEYSKKGSFNYIDGYNLMFGTERFNILTTETDDVLNDLESYAPFLIKKLGFPEDLFEDYPKEAFDKLDNLMRAMASLAEHEGYDSTDSLVFDFIPTA